MRAIAILFLLAASASAQIMGVGNRDVFDSGGGAVTLVQKAHSGAINASTATVAFTNNTAGDIAVIAIKWCSVTTAATVVSVTDTAGNAYTVYAASLATIAATHYVNCNTEFAYADPIAAHSGTNTVTVTMSNATANGSLGAFELTAGSLDQSNKGTNANTDVPTPGSITTAHNGSFYIAAGALDDGFGFASAWFTAGSPFTLNDEQGGANMNAADEYLAQTTAGAQAATFGSNYTSTTGPNAGSVITFRP